MFAQVLSALFGCWHRHYTFPMTVKKGARSRAGFLTGTYVVCLDCGQEMAYDWNEMKIVRPGALGSVASLAAKTALRT